MLPAKRQNTGQKKNAPSAIARALERVNARKEATKPVRIGFLVDATGSRNETWEQAQNIQAGMFKSVTGLRRLTLRLVYFGGNELTDHGWKTNARALAIRMAAVRCETGLTQILPGLEAFLDESEGSRARAIILVGDCFEEDSDRAEAIAFALKNAGIKVFAFHEGEDWTAQTVFTRLAVVTGGAFAKFGSDLPLGDLCEGVALLTAGGKNGLKRLANKRAKQLLLTGPTKTQKGWLL